MDERCMGDSGMYIVDVSAWLVEWARFLVFASVTIFKVCIVGGGEGEGRGVEWIWRDCV